MQQVTLNLVFSGERVKKEIGNMKDFDATTYKDAKGDFNNSDENLLVDFLSKNNSKARILDIGSGDGKLTSRIKSIFIDSDIVGIDNSPEQIKLSSEIKGINFILSDIVDFKSDKFDVIYAFYSFPHIPKSRLEEALASTKNLLNDGGVFYLFTNICLFDTSVATKDEQEACDVVFLNNWASQINLISLEEMRMLFDKVGFTELSNNRLETGAKIQEYGDMISWVFELK